MAYPKSLTPEQALQKARHYCGYQERCHQEVKEKLYGFGLHKTQVEQLLSQLIEEDYLNEERFARQFAGGKFRMKNWGRNRIQNELKQRQVSDYCIRKAMKEIPDDDYQATLDKIASVKWESLADSAKLVRVKKTQDYLLYKGYEWENIQAVIKKLQGRPD
ncbi:regulatory protein RecX [Flavihumibacter profundi]|uniref:regulatory protein RecX n=1 Tax=Flavihumibacter profundi TaxID=2716883 RepID=UPI001CC3D635|nr:regulatory protein RecX [Flavihumibacter profundi]MBZ5859055.1 RecX family transcriptional regulator [Flavihumibacter profundi]